MLQKFEISLKNEKTRLYNMMSWIIIGIHSIVFLYLGFFSTDKQIKGICLFILGLFVIFFLTRYFFPKAHLKPGLHIFFLTCMVAWISLEIYWMGAVLLIFDVLNSIATRPTITTFTNEKIVYPSFPVKVFQWKELKHTILKDGLLTLDFKNNKLIQQLIDPDKTSIDEKEFNDFCRQQLIK